MAVACHELVVHGVLVLVIIVVVVVVVVVAIVVVVDVVVVVRVVVDVYVTASGVVRVSITVFRRCSRATTAVLAAGATSTASIHARFLALRRQSGRFVRVLLLMLLLLLLLLERLQRIVVGDGARQRHAVLLDRYDEDEFVAESIGRSSSSSGGSCCRSWCRCQLGVVGLLCCRLRRVRGCGERRWRRLVAARQSDERAPHVAEAHRVLEENGERHGEELALFD